MSEKGYNGWTNYETWNYALWIGNDQGWQERCANAAHIVHCVNSHDALVARVAELEAALREIADSYITPKAVSAKARAALANDNYKPRPSSTITGQLTHRELAKCKVRS